MAGARIAEHTKELFDLVLRDAPIALGLDSLPADNKGHGALAETCHAVDYQHAGRCPRIHCAESLARTVAGEIVEGFEEFDETVVLGTVGVSHLCEGIQRQCVDLLRVVEEFHEGGLRGFEHVPVEVVGDWQTSVGVVAQKSFEARLECEVEDLETLVNECADAVGFACAGRPHK